MTTTTQGSDARAMTWQFVVPTGAPEMLVIADAEDSPDVAIAVDPGDLARYLRPAGWPAVAAPDLGAAVSAAARHDAGAVLELLAHQVARGGWLLVGVANSRYPGRGSRAGALSLGQLRRSLHRAGLTLDALYLALPDHRHPAALAAASPAGALDQLLLRLPTTYVSRDSRWPRTRRLVRALMAWAAAAAPHPVRVRLAPGYVVVARRSW